MKTKLFSGLKRISHKTATKVNRALAFVLSAVLLTTSVSVDALAAELSQSTLWEDYGVFKGTVFGTLGGGSKVSADYYAIEADENGDMHVAGLQKSSKISSNQDGFGMYYYQVPATSTFSFSAKATVNNPGDGGQSAFGLMARDNIHVDLDEGNIEGYALGNYVTAGTLGNGNYCFARQEATALIKDKSLAAAPAAGDTYNLSIESSDAGYVCTFGNEEAVTRDINLTTIDSENIYLCLFISRLADVTYSDIKLVVDGEVVFDQTVDEDEEDDDEDSEAGEGEESLYGTRTWKFDGTAESDAIEGSYSDTTAHKDVFEWAGMTIDATASGNGVYFNSGNPCTQFEPTVTAKIPAAGKYNVSLTGYGWGGANITVDGVKQDIGGDQTLTFEGTVGKEGYITVVFDGNGIWMKDITLTCEEVVKEEVNLYGTRTWKFDGTAESDAIEGSYSDTTAHKDVFEWAGMTIDATASGNGVYFNSGNPCTQFEPTVTAKIPAAGKYNVSLTGYGWGGANITVDGVKQDIGGDQTLTFEGTVGEEGYITVVFGGNGIWMKDITLTCEEATGEEGGEAGGEVKPVDPAETNGFIQTKPYAGVTYEFDLTNPNSPVYGGDTATEQVTPMVSAGLMKVISPAKYWNDHGTSGGMVVEIKVAGNSRISVLGCAFGGDCSAAVSSETGKFPVASQPIVKGCSAPTDFLYVGGEGSVKLTISGAYTHGIKVTPLADEEVPDLDVKPEVDPMEPDAFKVTEPNRKVTYVLNFADTISPIWDFQNGDVVATEDNRPYMKTGTTGLVTVNTPAKYWNSHGTNGAMDLDIAVTGDCRITISGCLYSGATDTYTVTSTTGTIEPEKAQLAQTATDGGAIDYMYDGPAGTIKLVGTGGYTHKVTITPIIAPEELFADALAVYNPDRKIDVWDFGGNLESDTDKYANYIEKSFWDSIEVSEFQDGNLGRFKNDGEYTFGDLVMKYSGSDRLYYNNEDGSAAGKYSNGHNKYKYDFADGYTSNGAWYAAGTGKNDGKDTRSILLKNVYAGDVINAYVFLNNSAMTLHCLYLGEDGVQDDTLPVALETYTQGTFTAQYTGNYLLYFNEGAGKPRYMRVTRTPGVLVTANVDAGSFEVGEFGIVLQDINTGLKYNAYQMEDGSFKAFAPANATLSAVMTDALGFGFTDTSKIVKTGSTAVSDITFVVEEKALLTLNGKVEGFAEGYDTKGLKLKLVLDCTDPSLLKDSAFIELNDDMSYSLKLEQGVEYKLTMTGCNDYELAEDFIIKSDVDVQKNIQIKAKNVYNVTGDFIGLAEGVAPASIEFTNLDDDYKYTGTVTATGYAAKLRDGEYEITAAVDGYNYMAHVIVKGADIKKDIMYVSKASATAIPFVADIYVGCPEQENNYATLREAVKAIEAMRLTDATSRITVHIAPGTYREQLQLKSPNVSFVNTDPSKEVKITFYYGIGYEYYSTSDPTNTGYYSEAAAFDKYVKKGADRWGSTVRIYGQATDFYAENITFENSFTKYMTEEELADGVAPQADLPERTAGIDVAQRKYNERSAALAVEGDKAEFYNCRILGGQDTLYTGSVRGYFHNCFIEGNTDYIFGSGEMIFENCELQFYGYSDTESGAVLTAATATQKYGYIFRNCFITQNPDWKVATASFGRPWGQSAMVYILNCKLQHTAVISEAGWGNMSNNTAEKANFNEFNTTSVDGKKVDTSKRVTGVITTNPYATSEDVINKAFSGWTPSTYVVDTNDVKVEKALTVTGEVKKGSVLTADFALNGNNEAANASVIQWYRVAADGTETLVKASTAYVDRTYTVAAEDAGAQIKVVVAPETVSGYTAETVSAIAEGVAEPEVPAENITDALAKELGVPVEEVSAEKLEEAYANATDKTAFAEAMKEAIVDFTASEIKDEMLSEEVVDMIAAVEEMQGVAFDVKAEDAADVVDDSKIGIVGAKLNADNNKDVSLVVKKDDKAEVDTDKYDKHVALDITLTGVQNTDKLIVPVKLTLPIPKGISSDKLVVIHIHGNGEDTLSAGKGLVINVTDGTVELTVTGFSTFVFANEADDDDNIKDGDDDDDDDDEDEEESKSILDAILSPKTFFSEGSFIHSILWPETDNEQEASVEQSAEAPAAEAADAEDADAAAGALVQTAEKNGIGNMFAIIIVAAVAVIAASGVILFRKKDE